MLKTCTEKWLIAQVQVKEPEAPLSAERKRRKKKKKQEEAEDEAILDAYIAQNKHKRIETAFENRRVLTLMTEYQKLSETEKIIEWPHVASSNEITPIYDLRLKEIQLFKLAEDDNFGSNIGVDFVTSTSESTMIRANNVKKGDVIKCTESNTMDFLYEKDEQDNSKIKSIIRCSCCAILFYDNQRKQIGPIINRDLHSPEDCYKKELKTIGTLKDKEQILGFGMYDPGKESVGSDLGFVSVIVWTPPKI